MISWQKNFFKELKHQFLINQHASSILRTNLAGDDIIIPTAQIWKAGIQKSGTRLKATQR